jgi:hypothetical protein
MFLPINISAGTRNPLLFLFFYNLIGLVFSQIYAFFSKIQRILNLCMFFFSFSGCRVVSNFAIFYDIKHMWDRLCYVGSML